MSVGAYFSRHAQVLIGSLGRIVHQPVSALMTMGVIAVALALPLFLSLLLQNARSATGNWNEAYDLSVYMDKKAGAVRVQALAKQLRQRGDVAAVRLSAHGSQRGRRLIRTGQTGDLMPGLEQFGHQRRADVSCRAGDENSHDVLPELAMSGNTTLRPVPARRPRLVSQYSIPIRHHYSSSRLSGYFSAGSTIIMRT